MKRVLIAFVVLVAPALWAAPVWAGGASADALLSDRDLRYQEQAIQNALEFNRTGQPETWKNAATGHRGRVTPTLTYRNSSGRDCRKFERRLKIDGRRVKYRGTRCRTAAGVWLRPVAPRPVYARGYDNHRSLRSRPRPYPYYAPVSIHLFYEIGRDRPHRRHRVHRHYWPNRHFKPHRHYRPHRHARPHRHRGHHRR